MAATNTVYISFITGFSPTLDYPDMVKSPKNGLAKEGYYAKRGANDVITVYSGPSPYPYAVTLTYTDHTAIILFYNLDDIQEFLNKYAAIAPVLESVLDL